jgi:hypothetical protein
MSDVSANGIWNGAIVQAGSFQNWKEGSGHHIKSQKRTKTKGSLSSTSSKGGEKNRTIKGSSGIPRSLWRSFQRPHLKLPKFEIIPHNECRELHGLKYDWGWEIEHKN